MEEQGMTPALNDESQENKLVALAFIQAQSQLEERTASSQVVTHFLKLGTKKAKVELENLKLQNKLLEEKILAERSGLELNSMLSEVLEALKNYSYRPPGEADVNVF